MGLDILSSMRLREWGRSILDWIQKRGVWLDGGLRYPWMDGWLLGVYGMFRSGHEEFLDGCFD
jgi:hypothetical protein